MKDGIYYDMPDADYHALQRLSVSGVKNLMISPMTFWSRSWMNPVREDDTDEWMLKGKAYHARVVEGRQQFADRYVYDIQQSDYPNALTTADDIKDRLRQIGEKLTGNKAELIARLRSHVPGVEVWDEIKAEYAKAHEGKTILPAKWLADIEVGAAFIERHPTIQHAFQGGHAEVTVLWTHEVEASDGTGKVLRVPMKSRFDRLKAGAIVDFKTYSSVGDMTPAKAIMRAMANQKYHMQAAIYYRANDYAVKMGWIEDKPRPFLFVFQGTGDDKVPRGRILPRESNWVDVGWRHFDLAAEKFMQNMERFGSDPWALEEDIETIADEEVPAWASD